MMCYPLQHKHSPKQRGLAIRHTLHRTQGKNHRLQIWESRGYLSPVLAVNPLHAHYPQCLCPCRSVLIVIWSPASPLRKVLIVFGFFVAVAYALISKSVAHPSPPPWQLDLHLALRFLFGFFICILDGKTKLSNYSSLLFIRRVITKMCKVLSGLIGQCIFCHR